MRVSTLAAVFGSNSLRTSQSPTNCTNFISVENSTLSMPDITAFPEPTALGITHFAAVILSQIAQRPGKDDC